MEINGKSEDMHCRAFGSTKVSQKMEYLRTSDEGAGAGNPCHRNRSAKMVEGIACLLAWRV